jgi:hypothetical protein
MDRRNISKFLVGSVAGAALLSEHARAQSCVAPCYSQTPAEATAGVTPTDTSFPPGDVRRYGAVGDGVTNDKPAIDNAFAACPDGGTVTLESAKSYSLGSGQIDIPANKSIDCNGSSIISTGVTVLAFGANSELYGAGAVIVGSGGAGAALRLTNPSTPVDGIHILGWPLISATSSPSSPVAGSIGLDFTASRRGNFEVEINEMFLIGITGGTSSVSPATYYNEFRSPRIRCATGGTGMRFRNGCNGTVVSNPQIGGAQVGTYGFNVDEAGSLTVLGGYVEAFAAANGTRGARINNSTNISFIGVTFDQTTSDATASQALEVSGTSTQINFYGNGFGGSWGSSNRILVKSGAGLYNFIGGAPTNQVCIIGASTWAGNYLNGYTKTGDLVAGGIIASSAQPTGYAHQLINTDTGISLLLRTFATSNLAARSALTVDRAGGYGYAVNFQNNGFERGGICFGSGSPQGVVTAVPGTLYTNALGGANTTLYVKESGTGNTGWVAK